MNYRNWFVSLLLGALIYLDRLSLCQSYSSINRLRFSSAGVIHPFCLNPGDPAPGSGTAGDSFEPAAGLCGPAGGRDSFVATRWNRGCVAGEKTNGGAYFNYRAGSGSCFNPAV